MRKAKKAPQAIIAIERPRRRAKERVLSERQLKYKKNRLKGMNRLDAGIAAGYSEKYMRHKSWMVEAVVRSCIIDEINRAGGTDFEIARNLVNIANDAMKPVSCTILIQEGPDGKQSIVNSEKITVPDLTLRKDTWELICKLKKKLVHAPLIDQSEHTHFMVVVEKSADGQENRLFSDGQAVDGVSSSN